MSQIEIKLYEKSAFRDFIYNGVEKDVCGTQIVPILDYYSKQGECFYGVKDGKILGAAGVYPLWEGTGGCFLFLNEEAKKYKKSVFKIIVQRMNKLTEKYKIKQLIVECMDGNIQANNFIEHLGFKKDKTVTMAVYKKEDLQ